MQQVTSFNFFTLTNDNRYLFIFIFFLQFFTPMTAILPVGCAAMGAGVLTVAAAEVAAAEVGTAVVAAVTQTHTQRIMLSSDYAVLRSKSMPISINIGLYHQTGHGNL